MQSNRGNDVKERSTEIRWKERRRKMERREPLMSGEGGGLENFTDFTRGHFQVELRYRVVFRSDNSKHKKIKKVLMWCRFKSILICCFVFSHCSLIIWDRSFIFSAIVASSVLNSPVSRSLQLTHRLHLLKGEYES